MHKQTGMPLRLAQAYILDTPVVESLVPQYPEFSASGGWGILSKIASQRASCTRQPLFVAG